MKASVLAIGTELTTGQITNRNSSWISAKLKAKGLLTEMHLTVPDDRALNLESLKLCALKSDVIFVTGGLGPTSDDFTRDVISEWCGQPLQFDEASWQHIHDRLAPRGIAVKEIQRQQCYFPKGAKVLVNQAGTANAFYLKHQNKEIFVLPGPPREIEAIWKDHVNSWLEAATKDLDQQITLSWDLLGLPESQVAEMVIATLDEQKVSKEFSDQLELGYRVHLPYVEFKLSFSKSLQRQVNPLIAAIDNKFGKLAVAKNGADILNDFICCLAGQKEVHILDQVTDSYLLTRVEPGLRKIASQLKWTLSNNSSELNNLAERDRSAIYLSLSMINEHEVRLGLYQNGQVHTEDVLAMNTSALMHERRQQYFAECALLFWTKKLNHNQ